MVYLVKKHLVNVLFIITSFIVFFEISLNLLGEYFGFAIYILSLHIWIITAVLIGLNEIKDMLLDYMNNKDLAKKIILIIKIIVWLGILALLYFNF